VASKKIEAKFENDLQKVKLEQDEQSKLIEK
jgi:hypothetical protein